MKQPCRSIQDLTEQKIFPIIGFSKTLKYVKDQSPRIMWKLTAYGHSLQALHDMKKMGFEYVAPASPAPSWARHGDASQ